MAVLSSARDQLLILEQIANDAPIPEILAAIAYMIESSTSGLIANIMLLDPEHKVLTIGSAPSLDPGFARLIHNLPPARNLGCSGHSAFTGEKTIAEDIATDFRWTEPFRRKALAIGLRSGWSLPIVRSNGEVLGTVALYANTPRLPTADEEALVTVATHLAEIAIERSRSHKQMAAQRRREEHWRERYEAALASLNRLFYVCYPREDKLLIRGSLKQTFGYPSEEQISTLTQWRALVHPHDLARLQLAMENACLQQVPFAIRYRIRTGSGAYTSVDEQGHCILGPDGKVEHLVGFIGNATEVIRREAQAEQNQRLDAMGHLASGIAHDFANLLQVICGNCELLTTGEDVSPSQRQLIQGIEDASGHAADLTSQLLTFSKGHSSAGPFTELNRALVELGYLLRRLVPPAIRLRIVPAPHPVHVGYQRAPIDQIITNLTLNSRDAIEGPGEISLLVSKVNLIRPRQTLTGQLPVGAYAVLEASDTGSGIDPATLPRIFEPFFTTKAADKGNGLGLATVYGIVRNSGGAIDIHSAVGVGTTMRVYLPLVEDDISAILSDVQAMRAKP